MKDLFALWAFCVLVWVTFWPEYLGVWFAAVRAGFNAAGAAP